MITIKAPESRQEIEDLYRSINATFCENSSGVIAKFGDEILGFCLFEFTEKGITVSTLEPKDDIMLADGILRSALHIAAERSLMDARYAETAPEELFSKLGFIKDRNDRSLDIDKLFKGCSCHEK